MPEIGETLREARMRRRIDMTEVETATKIRGKYLRALENEEWDLLPGPTFVKTFLRTYAEYLDLDPRLLVEEYRQRYERPSTQDLTPFTASRARAGRGGRRRRRLAAAGPALVLAGGVALLLAFLWALGTLGDDEQPTEPNQVREEPTPSGGGGGGGGGSNGSSSEEGERERNRARPPQRVRLQLIATAPVYVCVVDAKGRQVIDEETLGPDTTTRTLRSKRFLTNFGNDNVRMRVNGKTYQVAASADPIGYELLPGRKPRRLSDARRPDCSS
jgi:cytoskeleton protein RodZ